MRVRVDLQIAKRKTEKLQPAQTGTLRTILTPLHTILEALSV